MANSLWWSFRHFSTFCLIPSCFSLFLFFLSFLCSQISWLSLRRVSTLKYMTRKQKKKKRETKDKKTKIQKRKLVLIRRVDKCVRHHSCTCTNTHGVLKSRQKKCGAPKQRARPRRSGIAWSEPQKKKKEGAPKEQKTLFRKRETTKKKRKARIKKEEKVRERG